jgi:hypothetical protein
VLLVTYTSQYQSNQGQTSISTFVSNLNLLKRNVGRHELYQFCSLPELDGKHRVQTDDLHVYCDNLNLLHEDMIERFKGLVFLLEVPD